MKVLAIFPIRVRPRSATPLYCGVSADVNSRLMRCFLQMSLSAPPFNSLASSERMISGIPTSRTSAKNCSSPSGASDLRRRYYSHIILVLSSRNMMAYCLPPLDVTGFLPLKSTKLLPSFLSDLFRVVVGTEAMMPFAEEHPKHGRSLTPGFNMTPCCFRFPSVNEGEHVRRNGGTR